MLTRLTIRNFKRFREVNVELGNPVVFIGPNDSGKTSALQALALWEIGLRRWNEKRGGKGTVEKRPGVAINRRDLNAVPVPDANLLWHDLHVRDVHKGNDGKPDTRNVRIDVIVEGVANDRHWKCGLEFDYANEESLYCRPLRIDNGEKPARMPIPDAASGIRVAFLPPMSGLADREFAKQAGEISFLIGQGRTAEVLRNLCRQIVTDTHDGKAHWKSLMERIQKLFGHILDEPKFIDERSEIVMTYQDKQGVRLDLSSAGRGLHQTLLLLAYLDVNPGSVLLLDEPDAHLEILRQRQIYRLLTETAREQGSQIIAASHSEVVLNEAGERDVVVAFVGQPHRIDDRGAQLLKSLRDIGFEEYYQAEEKGWVLYLEGSTDLAILQACARVLEHPVARDLELPFVRYVENQPNRALEHFRGLREAKTDLVGFTLCDRLERDLQPTSELNERMWTRREIENYLCQPETLKAFARSSALEASPGPLFNESIARQREKLMEQCIQDLVPPVALRSPRDTWWVDTKASTDFLDRLFDMFYQRLGIPNLMRKSNYHILAEFVPKSSIDPEVISVLDAIHATAARARPTE